MTIELILFFEDLTSDEVQYALFDGGNQIEHGKSSITELSSRVSGLEDLPITAVIPGVLVSSWLIKMPRGSQRHQHKALRFVLEEDIVSAPETVHIATIAPSNREETVAMVIDQAVLKEFISRLVSNRLRCVRVIPDYLLLTTEKTPVMSTHNGRVIVRFPDGTGMTLPHHALRKHATEQWRSIDYSELTSCAGIRGGTSSLLQGDFSPRYVPRSSRRAVVAAAIIALFMTVAHVAYFVGAGLHFHREGNLAYEAAERYYRSIFPEEERIVNIRRQMEGRLATSSPQRGTDRFLDLLGGLAHVHASKPSTIAAIRHINFSAEQNYLVADIHIHNLSAITEISHLLAHSGISSEVLSAGRHNDDVNARLSLR